MGHRTEGLEKFARDIPEDRCFSIVFKDQRSTLDLIAPSSADTQHWVQGLRKIIHHSGSMDQRQKLQQYPLGQGVPAECGMRGGLFSAAVTKHQNVLVTFLIAGILEENKSGGRVYYGLRECCGSRPESWQQERDTGSYIVSAVRKQRGVGGE